MSDESDARKTLLTLAMLGSSAVNSSSDEKTLRDDWCISGGNAENAAYRCRNIPEPGEILCYYCLESHASETEVARLRSELARTNQAIEDIRALHNVVAYDEAGNHFCEHSRLNEPCETARILSGLSEHQEGTK